MWRQNTFTGARYMGVIGESCGESQKKLEEFDLQSNPNILSTKKSDHLIIGEI